MMKSNKIDVENNMRAVDILHKQLTHVVVLMIELIKTSMTNQMESETSRQSKRMFVLSQAIKVC